MKIKRILYVGLAVAGIGVYALSIYRNVVEVADVIYIPVETEEVREIEVDLSIQEPISILLLGIDRGEFGRTGQGRSDSMIIVTMNPEEETTKMVSIPRDSRSEIVGMYFDDKINHAYAYGGVEMAINTVQNLLDVPIDYYVMVNMAGMQALVDAVGGVEVDNDLDFTFENVHFPVGTVYLNGENALRFSRMRKQDPRGDFGRQQRQRLIIEALMLELLSFSNVTQFNQILGTVVDYVETDIPLDDAMTFIFGGYQPAFNQIEHLQLLVGEGQVINGVYYQILSHEEIANASTILREHLGLEVLQMDIYEQGYG